MRAPLAFFLLLTANVPCAMAADTTASSTLEAVTVFPMGAQITRSAKVQLVAGDQVVILRDLPASLVGDSVRVQGEASGKVEIGSVDTRTFYLSELADAQATASARKKLEDALQALTDQKQAQQAVIDTANAQKQLIQNLTQLPTRPEAASATSPAPDWGQIFTLIGARLAEANKTILDTSVAMRETDRKIADLQNQLSQQPQGEEQRTEVKIHITAATPLDATLRIHYQVAAASWVPIYDARLATGDGGEPPKLTLVRRAIISQQTGESWDNVQLSLSTTRPQAGTAAPEIAPIDVDIEKPVTVSALRKKKGVSSSEDTAVGGMLQDEAKLDEEAPVPAAKPMAPPPPTQVAQTTAEIVTSAFQALYIIPDRQDIKSGVGDKRVQIDTKVLEPSLRVRAVPKFSEAAYLYAKIKLDPELLLLPGGASLYRDGVFVGRGDIPQMIGGEEHELGFGIDDKVRVKFVNLGSKSGQSGLISTSRTDTRAFKFTIKNLHGRPIDARILDQLPVSLNEQIKVEMLSNTTAPAVTDIDDKRGVLAWDYKLEPNQEQVITFGYQVSWPNEASVVYGQHEGPWVLQH